MLNDSSTVDVSLPTAAANLPAHLLEDVSCCVCGADHYTILTHADFPEGISSSDLLAIYRSSSDQKLMDQMVQCRQCSFVYLNPRVKSSIIVDSYKSAVDPVFFKQNPLRVRTFKKSLAKIIKGYGIAPSKDKTVLDVGCAGGAFPKAAHDLGFRAIGIEPSRWLVDEGKKLYGIDLRAGLLEEQNIPPESCHIVTMWDVIEHLTTPQAVLKQLHSVLRNDGLLVVNYPDYGSLARLILQRRWPFFLSVHLFYFTRQTIKRFLRDNGFEVLGFKPYWQTLELGYVLQRAAAYLPMIGLIAKAVNAMGLGSLPLTYNMGQTMVIARKAHGTS